ncbi:MULTISPECIES: radical SAM/SPASM domain-containing protein [Mesorhizobium]|uniref:radical SAM/SPASM domain-containing protein n=1 Tax=Mesorhizobium TaxID=68287 RepID=UPI0007ECEF7B|nr:MULTISPECIES: radical SAM protein [Mesorhizobium]TPJ40408.1 SPASM domain-containing protein [Mesorhizobium sp. B2-6-6]ARP67209.1 radical SAM/SPASM domain-containing protein [Mesorhizobium sp. WSM1497]MCA0002795.1 SPASM domain-containing protein [Mesorhizobium sp. B264B2A]MCA0009054.1 SPASM domain-containing protein [Mesorhizobium sp. B264B1B]MCA0014549.1 SPASM domain-containing protein [Mesorhizobium sp. B294B1A1]
MYSTSRYNFSIPTKTGSIILYNARTGASRHFAGSDAADLGFALCRHPAKIDLTNLGEALSQSLLSGGFVVEPGFDEIKQIRELFLQTKAESPIIVTITTTNNCNLGCFYCFQKRDESTLEFGNVDKIVERVENILTASGKPALHIDWYGGEPMLNRAFLEKASSRLQALCNQLGRRYSASILTNGTLWPGDPLAFARIHMIERVQVTFDGFGKSHNKVRRYRRGFSGEDQFQGAIRLIEALKRDVTVDIRFNLGTKNSADLVLLAEFGMTNGWFEKGSKATLQIAKLTPYSTEVDFIRKTELAYAEFEAARDVVRAIVPEIYLDKTAALDRYPHPRRSVCAAIAEDSIVIGADGSLYNCGLQVTEPHRAVGQLDRESTAQQATQEQWWDGFDPTRNEKCSTCSFLPLCWGACPKLHLERDTASLDQQSEFWRTMLPRRLTSSLGLQLPTDFALTATDQFKSAPPDRR